MRKLIWVVMMVLVMMAFAPLHLGNAYLRTSRFDVIRVERGENVWSISERYVKQHADIPKMAEAIIEVNSLDNEGNIRTGQTLRIPIVVR